MNRVPKVDGWWPAAQPGVRPARATGMAGDDRRARKHDAMKWVAKVQDILRRWDPIGVRPGEIAPADEYDGYAPHIVSMVAGGCSIDDLWNHLNTVRVNTIGVEPNPDRDREIANEILVALRDRAV